MTMIQAQEPATGSGPSLKLYRLSVSQFKAMIAAGVFQGGARVELLAGILVEKMTKNDPHDYAVDFLGKELDRLLAPTWIAREEKSVELGHRWRPEPDIAVVRGPRNLYVHAAPKAADIALIAEVSASSASRDQKMKWRKYAAARIPYYWILLIGKKQIEVHSRPIGRGTTAKYQDIAIYSTGSQVPVIVEDKEMARIALSDVMP